MIKSLLSWTQLLPIILMFVSPGSGFSQVPYYQGKTINMLVGTEAGGTGDMRARSVVRLLQKYIPGNPTIVLQFMPGGGGRKAANHIFTVVRPDALTIGVIGSGLVANAVLGATGVNYDLDKLIFLGSGISKFQRVFVTRNELGLNTLEKLKAYPGLRIGGQSVGSEIYVLGRLFAYMLELRQPIFIPAYGGAELDIALDRGEIDARGNTIGTILLRNPDWIGKKRVNFHVTIEVPKGYRDYPHAVFAGLPEIESFSRSDKERKVLALYRAMRGAGSPFILPPGTPETQTEILREAFRKVYRDPEFHKEFQKFTSEEATPISPDEQEKLIREMPRDPDVIKLFNAFAGSGPLPSR